MIPGIHQPKDHQSAINRREISRLVRAAGEGGMADSYGGKRQATRVAEGMHLEVTLDPAKAGASWAVIMHNISDGGFAFWSKQALDAGTNLHVREFSEGGKTPWLPAYATHCTRGIRGFLVGAAFMDANGQKK